MSGQPETVWWTGIGSWPGTDVLDATKIAFAECPHLPYLPELPERGVGAQVVGRTAVLLSGMSVDLQPAGWRLTDAPGRDARQARSLFRSDLDALEEVAQGYAGPLKVGVGGPWTAVATLERPRGDRVLADHGARRDVGQSLAEGLGELVAELGRRLPDVSVVLQLDEPMLPAVLAGAVPTASGFSRHRAVDLPEVSQAYRTILERLAAVRSTPAPVVVHCCAAGAPVRLLLEQSGLDGVALDLDQMTSGEWDAVGASLDAGRWFGAGVVPTQTGAALPGAERVATRVLGRLDQLGLDAAAGLRTVLTPACGLGGTTREHAIATLRTLRHAAEILTDRLLG